MLIRKRKKNSYRFFFWSNQATDNFNDMWKLFSFFQLLFKQNYI